MISFVFSLLIMLLPVKDNSLQKAGNLLSSDKIADLSSFSSSMQTSLNALNKVFCVTAIAAGNDRTIDRVPDPAYAAVSEADLPLSFYFLLAGTLVGLLIIATFFLRRRFFRYSRGNKLEPENLDLSFEGFEEYKGEGPEINMFTPTVFSSDSSHAILVAEEDEDMRLFLTNTLRLNYRVIGVTDGMKAYNKAIDMVPDLIVASSSLTGMDCPSLCHTLKSTDATNHIPLVILAGKNDQRDARGQIPFPAEEFLTKPFDARTLLITVNRLIAFRKRLQISLREQIFADSSIDTSSPEVSFMQKVNEIIGNRFHDAGFSGEELAEKLGMNKIQAYRKFKALINKSPGDYIKAYRIEKAKLFLQNGDSQLSDVASKSGFVSLTAFAKTFKDHTGVNPVDYSVNANFSVEK